jgi:hypothetical protein
MTFPRTLKEKGVSNMEESRETEEFVSGLKVNIAFVQVKLAESYREAWNRHLKENPGDVSAMVLIFNQPGPQHNAVS